MPTEHHGATIGKRNDAITLQQDEVVKTLVYEGTYAAMVAIQPAYGSTPIGYAGFFVVRSSVEPLDGGLARLTVELSDNDPLEPPADDYEIDWVEVEQDIWRHPIYAQGGAQELTDAQRAVVRKAINEGNDKAIADCIAAGNNGIGHLFQRLSRGQTSYSIYLPVVKATTHHETAPTTGGCGAIEDPPAWTNFPTHSNTAENREYIYVKLADSLRKQGQWFVRSQQWMGFVEVDTDIVNAL